MDKSEKVHESQSDTSSVITMKEYAPSEYPSSEPPPAYMKPRSNALRIAKLAAFTVIVSSIILGGFILAASWIQANTARNLDLTLNQELLDDLHPSYEHLVANELIPDRQQNAVDQDESKKLTDESQASSNTDNVVDKNKNGEEDLLPPPAPAAKAEEKKVLDLDEIANILMQKNLKGNVNCIVEKRKNEELVDHAPMTLNLPAINITTPPRLQHLTGEQMIVVCKGDDDEKESESEEEGDDENGKVEQLQSIIFPLPNHLLNQIQQVPQIIPLQNILHQIPLQQVQIQQIPVQQMPVQQMPVQQMQVQQMPVQQIPVQQIPLQQIPVQQIPVHQFPQNLQPQQQQQQPPRVMYHQPLIIEQLPQQQQQHQFQQPQQQVILPQKMLFPQQLIQNNQPNVQFIPEMTPLKEIRVNQDRIPMNHILHHRVPVNPLAVNDVPISRMPITHLPLRAEAQMREEPVPVHHLVPPQPQQYQAENFRQEEPKYNGPIIQEVVNRVPFFQPQMDQQRPLPVEVRDPGVLQVPASLAQEPRERFPMPPPSNQYFPNNFPENREADFMEEIPNRGFRQLTVDIRSRGQRKEPVANTLMPEMPKVSPMIPLNFERGPQGNGRRIRFPEMDDQEEIKENRLPIITEITKIIPIRLENDDQDINDTPITSLNSQPKNLENAESKNEKISPRPFPIPINAILDMIFRGIRPLMGHRGSPLPIPIDIKIERIENKPVALSPPFIKKFEVIKKGSPNGIEPEDIFQNSNVQSILSEKSINESAPDKNVVEAKVERVEIFDREDENGQPIPIPADAQDPQIFKIEDQGKATDESSFEDQAFLPNGQGRGARVFPIPQRIKEAEIFSVYDAKSDKNMDTEVPVESSITVVNPEKERIPGAGENRQGRFMGFPGPIINFFPLSDQKVMKPIIQAPKVQPQSFSAPESKSIKLIPVSDATFTTDGKATNPAEENRPHFVQPRSV